MRRAGAVAIVCAGIGCVDLLCVDALLLPAWAAERRGATTIAAAGLVPGEAPQQSGIAASTTTLEPTIAAAPDPTTPKHVARTVDVPAAAIAIRFARTGSAQLDAAAQRRVAEIARRMHADPDAIVAVEGHADARGRKRVNVGLSRQRAHAVADELQREGIPAARIAVSWSGERDPVKRGRGDAVWAANRRVELELREGK